MEKIHVFLDETGAFGFDFSRPNCSSHFIIVAALVNESQLNAVTDSVESIRKFKVVPMKYRPLLDSNRLLIIFLGYGLHPCREYAASRNEYIASITDRLVFASINPESSLYPIYTKYNQKSTLIYE